MLVPLNTTDSGWHGFVSVLFRCSGCHSKKKKKKVNKNKVQTAWRCECVCRSVWPDKATRPSLVLPVCILGQEEGWESDPNLLVPCRMAGLIQAELVQQYYPNQFSPDQSKTQPLAVDTLKSLNSSAWLCLLCLKKESVDVLICILCANFSIFWTILGISYPPKPNCFHWTRVFLHHLKLTLFVVR